MLEVKHNELNLPAKKRFVFSCLDFAYKKLESFMAEKRVRGYRLRYIKNIKTKTIQIEHRTHIDLLIAANFLSKYGKEVPPVSAERHMKEAEGKFKNGL